MQSSEPSPNPYAAPQAPLAPAVVVESRTWLQRIGDEWKRKTWPQVFFLNLGVPGLLGYGLCSRGGFWGVLLVMACLLMFTTWLAAGNPLRRTRLISGGMVVAAFQLFPVFHLLLGILSLELLVRFNLVTHLRFGFGDEPLMYEPIGFWPACLLSLMVGGGLLWIAYLIGIWRVPDAEQTKLGQKR